MITTNDQIMDANMLLSVIELKKETQVILRLLLNKNMITSDELNNMREYVNSQPFYTNMENAIKSRLDKLSHMNDIESAYERILKGNDTEEDRKLVLEYLDENLDKKGDGK